MSTNILSGGYFYEDAVSDIECQGHSIRLISPAQSHMPDVTEKMIFNRACSWCEHCRTSGSDLS